MWAGSLMSSSMTSGIEGKSLGHSFRQLHAPAESGEDDLGALLERHPGSVPGDGGVGQHPGDHESFAFEQHAFLPGPALGGHATP